MLDAGDVDGRDVAAVGDELVLRQAHAYEPAADRVLVVLLCVFIISN